MADGYYTREELLQLWVDGTDKSYNRPFVEKGDGGGLEVFNQAFAQFERASVAIRNTFQSMYILPWSGQTADPASGDRYATVELKLSREPTILPAPFFIIPTGTIVLEEATDHSTEGSVEVLTGREYALDNNVVWLPGNTLDQTAQATATVPGWGPNNPMPGTLKEWRQNGKSLSGTRANIVPGFPRCFAVAAWGGDGFIPSHVGQYVQFSSGYNAGVVRRIVGQYGASGTDAGQAELESTVLLTVSGAVGTFAVGEPVTHSGSGAKGVVVHYDAPTGLLVIERIAGVFDLAGPPTITGDTSGATAQLDNIDKEGMLVALSVGPVVGAFQLYETITQAVSGATGLFAYFASSTVYIKANAGPNFDAANLITGGASGATATPTRAGWDPLLVPEPNQTAGWGMVEWEAEFGITVTNELSPEGGRIGMLDELGLEKNMPRIPGESDADYRNRISKPADTVSPNAILRAMIRALDPLGVTGCFREVGQPRLKGFYYDVDPASAPDYAFAYDMDPTVRPGDRWKVYLDYASFRAFFLVGIPSTNLGEFGFAYDNHPLGAYDSSPALTFYDGFPVTTVNAIKALWNDINNRKAGGVGFEFYQETDGCV